MEATTVSVPGLRLPGMTEPADTTYRIDREHDPSEDDLELAVPWPLRVTVLSGSDRWPGRNGCLRSNSCLSYS